MRVKSFAVAKIFNVVGDIPMGFFSVSVIEEIPVPFSGYRKNSQQRHYSNRFLCDSSRCSSDISLATI
jgi:hypothetical protein